jgi:acetyl esterase/lipase
VVVGHSAGGHLALWAAARRGLPRESPLYAPEAFVPGQVISLAGIPDLKSFGRYVPMHCGPGVYESLAPDGKIAEVSPAALPAPPVRVVLVSGVVDRLVPPYVAHDFARARLAEPGPQVQLVDLPDAGHFDLVTATTPAWSRIRGLIVDALSRKTAARR